MVQIVFIVIFLFLMFKIIQNLLLQREKKFEILIKVYPRTLVDKIYNWHMWVKIFSLPFHVQLWLYSPFYYHLDFEKELNTQHEDIELRNLNRKFYFYFVALLICLFLAGIGLFD